MHPSVGAAIARVREVGNCTSCGRLASLASGSRMAAAPAHFPMTGHILDSKNTILLKRPPQLWASVL